MEITVFASQNDGPRSDNDGGERRASCLVAPVLDQKIPQLQKQSRLVKGN